MLFINHYTKLNQDKQNKKEEKRGKKGEKKPHHHQFSFPLYTKPIPFAKLGLHWERAAATSFFFGSILYYCTESKERTNWLKIRNFRSDLRYASPMASNYVLWLPCFLFPNLANVLCNPHCIKRSTREPSPCEPNCIQPWLPLPPTWKLLFWEPIFWEKITSLKSQKSEEREK